MTGEFTPPSPPPARREPYRPSPTPSYAPSPTPPDGQSFAPLQGAPISTVGQDYLVGAPGAPGQPPAFRFPGTEEVNPAEVFAGPGYTSPAPPSSTWARIAVIAAVLGVVPGISLLAVVAGHLALREIGRSHMSGRGAALAGLALGYIGVAVWLLVALVWSIAS